MWFIRQCRESSLPAPHFPDFPTAEEFHFQIFYSDEIIASIIICAMKNTSEFTACQLALMLAMWGAQHNLDHRQGVIVTSAPDRVVTVPDRPGLRSIIWIHNNNAIDLRGAKVNHYSGIAPYPAPGPVAVSSLEPRTAGPEKEREQQPEEGPSR